jgi:hypothetical protein
MIRLPRQHGLIGGAVMVLPVLGGFDHPVSQIGGNTTRVSTCSALAQGRGEGRGVSAEII